MSVVVLEFGTFSIMAKYLLQKRGSALWYFRRRIPDDVRKHYPGKKNGYLIFSLQTNDLTQAAKLANQKALEQDAMWKSIRDGGVPDGPELVLAAKAILTSHNLKPGQHSEYRAADLEPDDFINELLYQADVTGSHDQHPNWHEDLPPVYRMAGDLFYGAKEPVFLSAAGITRRRVINDFTSQFGDLPIERYSRDHAKWVCYRLA